MDGTDETVIVQEDLYFPFGIALDLDSKHHRLCTNVHVIYFNMLNNHFRNTTFIKYYI